MSPNIGSDSQRAELAAVSLYRQPDQLPDGVGHAGVVA
jgi:hypothetical protein